MHRPVLTRRARTPLVLASAATVAAALLATTAGPASAGRGHGPSPTKPTVVLVHGAFADSTSWNDVVKELRRDGYPVVSAANPLRGLKSDAAYVRQLVDSIDGPVVLAGHSYGGAVISDAARGAANVRALVFIAAYIPEKGESAAELTGKYPGSTLSDALRSVPVTLPGGGATEDLYIEQAKFHHQFAADVPRNVTDLMAVAQRPVTSAALAEKAGEPAWRTIPAYALVATQDLNIPPKAQVFMAERARAFTVKVKASHAVSVSRPHEVADILELAAARSR
ncbi:alpha/beta fold hydrolase [Streptomyces justiciae]|uniref:Alpha/beta hydrolase n=1 Tax=Streptomyces justiciae TaxID=2780140 RepID=A0ABU3M2D0_9ACTN|nr:alpha/beta hydrolase [Streptomyces justiciae]MDT7845669.1 alpha/beta hydrolase [Streptomyces justiciae]